MAAVCESIFRELRNKLNKQSRCQNGFYSQVVSQLSIYESEINTNKRHFFYSYFTVVHSVDRSANNSTAINHKAEYEMVDEHFGDEKGG